MAMGPACSIDGADPLSSQAITAFRITGAVCDIACTTTESSSMPAAVFEQVALDGFVGPGWIRIDGSG